MKIKKSVRFGVFRQFVLSYLIIELVILASLIPLYQMTLSTTRARQIDEEYVRIRGTVSRISVELDSAAALMVLLSRSDEMRTIASYSKILTPVEQYKTAKQRRLLQIALFNWDFIEDYYLFFARNEVVMSAERVWFSHDSFYDRWFAYEGVGLDSWSENMRDSMKKPSKGVRDIFSLYTINIQTLRTEAHETLVFAVPFTEWPESGMGLFLIPFEHILDAFELENGNDLRLYGVDGTPMLTDGEYIAPFLDIEDGWLEIGRHTQFTVRDDVTGLTFVITVSTDKIGSSVKSAYERMFVYVIIAALVGSLISAYFAHRHYRSVKRVSTAVSSSYAIGDPDYRDYRDYRDEYEYFIEMFLNMRRDNQEYSATIETYHENMRRRALDDLLFRRYKNDREFKRLCGHVPLPAPYRVAIVHVSTKPNELVSIPSEIDTSMINIEVISVFEKIVTNPLFAHPLSEQQLLFVIPADISQEQLDQTMHQLRQKLRSYQDTSDDDIFFALSHIYEVAGKLWQAFDEARSVISFRHHCPENIVFIEDLEARIHPSILSEESSSLLKSFVSQGDEERAMEFIESALGINYLRTGDYRQLFYSVRGVLVQLAEEIQLLQDADIQHYFAYLSHEEMTQGLLETCHKLCVVFTERKKKQGDALNQKILKYLDENFRDPSIYGKSVAALFNMKEKYLYGFFKEHNDVSPSSYLERLRLEQADKLLTRTKLGISEIAEQVGFNSTNTFYKAFLRFYGTAPSDYRVRNS